MTSLLAAPSPTPSRLRGAIAGLVAAFAALATGELFAGLFRTFDSPFLIVAEKFIDLTPKPLKDFAIDVFGENDKIALIVGAVVFVFVAGLVVGAWSRRRPVIGYVFMLLVGVTALISGATSSPGLVGSLAVIPAVPVGIVVLRRLLEAGSPAAEVRDGDDVVDTGPDRRQFLVTSGIAAGAVAFVGAGGRLLQRRFSAESSRAAVTLPDPVAFAPDVPASVSADGAVPFITPFDEFYRVDTAIEPPQVAAEEFNLRVFGMVDNELNLSYQDILDRDLEEHTITLTCVSNTVGGDLMGTATWRGIRLDDLLNEAGVQDGATQVIGRSVDDYTAGFPVEVAMDGRDALVVVGMNGEPLPIDRGFPARLIVPGLYGYVSATKWLKEIQVTTFEEVEQYWVPRGWDAEAPIKMSSRIDTPVGAFDGTVEAGTVVVAGVAWAQTTGIAKVELKIDDADWVEVDLADELNIDTWRQWSYVWEGADPGLHSLTVRATDKDGNLQIEDRTEPFPNAATGWQTQRIRVA